MSVKAGRNQRCVCVLGTATFSSGDAHGVRGAARLRSCEREKRLMMVIGDMREKSFWKHLYRYNK